MIALGLLIMSMTMFFMGWYVSGNWKKGLELLGAFWCIVFIYMGLMLIVTGLIKLI